MSVAANKAQTMEIINNVWNRGDMDALDTLISPDFINHTSDNPREGRDGFKARVQMIRTAFPDWELVVEDMIGEGDKVVTRWRAHGTHRGRFAEIEPSGRQIEVTGIAIDRVIGGKRVEGWVQWDMQGLLRQLTAEDGAA